MKVFSKMLNLPAGLPLGGYAGERLSVAESSEMEVNGWAFSDSKTGKRHELYTLDTLFPGDIPKIAQLNDRKQIFAASHTHTAPMLDSGKPKIGKTSPKALKVHADAVLNASWSDVAPDQCQVYSSKVSVPVYRRFDVPDSPLNRFLTARAGMYPNEKQPIDTSVNIFVFTCQGETQFVFVQHASHPVSRHDLNRTSPDYVGILRKAVRQRFGAVPCLFLLGCAGDIRPNFARKRSKFLPKNRFNWRFESPSSKENEENADRLYAEAVATAKPGQCIKLDNDPVMVKHCTMVLTHRNNIEIPCLTIGGKLRFEFVPFEVSHYFHLDIYRQQPMRFIISCCDNTFGYLPHPSQIRAGGYEVDGSRDCMGLPRRVLLEKGKIW